MKIIAVIAAFLSIVSGAGIYVNINTGNMIRPDEVKPAVVCETEAVSESAVTSEAVSETESVQTVSENTYSEEVQETTVPAVTEIQITETAAETETQQVTEKIVTALPEAAYDEKISEVTVSETEEPEYFEYQVLYKELLDELRYETENISTVKYLIFDMNYDDVPELVTVTGTCEADMVTTFYTIKNHQVAAVGENFRGDHCGFYRDSRNGGLVIRNDWSGLGNITEYAFDGEEVYKVKGIEDYDYMVDPEGYEEAVAEMFDLEYEVYGEAYADGSSNFFTLCFDMIELNEGSYYFTD